MGNEEKCAICRQYKVFNQRLFIDATIRCGICLESKAASEFLLADCGHAFCKECINPITQIQKVSCIRDSSLSPVMWLARYEPNTMIISRHWMNTDRWPRQVIDYIDQNWTKYPQNTDMWPETAIYYKLN